jgi:hypothetical protein
MSKILIHYKISYEDLIDIKCKGIKFKENTHILSYYIFRTIILFNLEKFERWCIENNESLFRFSLNDDAIMDYFHFIKISSKDEYFLYIIEKMSSYLKSPPNDISPILKNTMRMSFVDCP